MAERPDRSAAATAHSSRSTVSDSRWLEPLGRPLGLPDWPGLKDQCPESLDQQLHHNVLAIALANKLARIAWSVLARGRAFEASKIQVA